MFAAHATEGAESDQLHFARAAGVLGQLAEFVAPRPVSRSDEYGVAREQVIPFSQSHRWLGDVWGMSCLHQDFCILLWRSLVCSKALDVNAATSCSKEIDSPK